MAYITPHNQAPRGAFANTVLMPGDPLRSKYIAENFLDAAELVNNVRGVQGYTGYYKGKRVSVMASGMGMPAIGIYSQELFQFYDVTSVIRIGSCGSLDRDLHIRDLIIAQGACTDSNYADQYRLPGTFCPTGSWRLLQAAADEAAKRFSSPALFARWLNTISAHTLRQILPWQTNRILIIFTSPCPGTFHHSSAAKDTFVRL